MKKYTKKRIQNSLNKLNEDLNDEALWVIKDSKLTKHFKFDDFIDAFGWMSQVAMFAETLKHHPDWSNSYNKVAVSLMTHELSGLSELDFTLAKKMEHYAK
ncbi:MAG: 4a-hydroxytetrahydrobiopterin dehydratase [Paraglaciecola sp.]|uniref:4a-hydroxytetrahydrobiopterin dehydratase n=1 Tax=Paraglaciecola sp. TaxID=1920173 RepID=UPI003267BF53